MTDTIFFRLLEGVNRPSRLSESVEALREGGEARDVYLVDPRSLRQVPNVPMAYWAPPSTLDKFQQLGLYKRAGEVKQGLATKDNERFVRAWWEVPVQSLSLQTRWAVYAKGGEYAKHYLPFALVVDWSAEAQEIYRAREGQMVVLLTSKKDQYLNRPGITYSKRSQLGFSARVLPQGAILVPTVREYFQETTIFFTMTWPS